MNTVSSSAIKSALMCASKRDIRRYLEGVYVEKRGDHITIVGADGYVMFVCREKAFPSDPDFAVIIPNADASAGITKNKSVCVDVEPMHDDIWSIGGHLFRPTEGRFPDYRKVIPTGEPSGEIGHFDPEKLLKAFKAVSSHSGSSPVLQMNGRGPGIYASSNQECMALVMPLAPETLDITPPIRAFQEWALEGYVGDVAAAKCAANTIPLYREQPAPAVPDAVVEFLREIKNQIPEKPDHWNSCGQCERNSDKADDLLELIYAAPQPPEQSQGEKFFAQKRAEVERDMARGARISDHRFSIDEPHPPAVSNDKADPDYKALFHRAVSDIALIEEALGIPEDESSKSAQYLAEAAAELRRQIFSYESMVADRDELLAKRDLDAERYRIARDSFGVSQVNLAICEFEDQSGGLGAYLPMNPDDADAAIDAMQEIKK